MSVIQRIKSAVINIRIFFFGLPAVVNATGYLWISKPVKLAGIGIIESIKIKLVMGIYKIIDSKIEPVGPILLTNILIWSNLVCTGCVPYFPGSTFMKIQISYFAFVGGVQVQFFESPIQRIIRTNIYFWKRSGYLSVDLSIDSGNPFFF